MPHAILILAAGLGKRMRSPLPKVLHEVSGEPMLSHILHCVKSATLSSSEKPDSPIGIIVGHGRELVEEKVRAHPELGKLNLSFLVQSEQKGTGHAVRSAMDTDWGRARAEENARILVLPGDLPLLPETLVSAMLAPLAKGSALRLLTCELPDPFGYGRVVRKGKFPARIVEEKDASPAQRKIREVAASIYTFDARFLAAALPKLSTKNAQGEYYLTDVVGLGAKAKKKMEILEWANPEDVRGVNDLWELAQAENLLNARIIRAWAREGVRFIAPETSLVERGVRIGAGVRIHRGVVLRGTTTIGDGSEIGSNAVLRNMTVGAKVSIRAGTYAEESEIQDEANVGPYAHLRPGSVVGRKAKIGNFVELKKARVGEGTSVAHLSYLGDAEVGDRVNIGCGFITCNFDGRVVDGSRKHKTVIEDDVFMGSDCQAIAPIRIGRGAYVASGSTLAEDVEADSLAIARARQVNKPGYARKLREKKD